MTRQLSLTPNPDCEAEDLDTVLSLNFVCRALAEHRVDICEFFDETGRSDGNNEPVRLGELRDFLGY